MAFTEYIAAGSKCAKDIFTAVRTSMQSISGFCQKWNTGKRIMEILTEEQDGFCANHQGESDEPGDA